MLIKEITLGTGEEEKLLLLVNNNRVFFPSKKVNIFPCSRRGQYGTTDYIKFYDPEARLNTERTNRISTAINGYKDSFIDTFTVDDTILTDHGTLIFVLAGYRVEVKDLSPTDIAAELGIAEGGTIYAHLSLHTGVSLNIDDYATEILYRQSEKDLKKNYLDVPYSYTNEEVTPNITYADDFFVGISFTANDTTSDGDAIAKHLPLFTKVGNTWQIVQASLLPQIDHDVDEDSVVLGKLHVEQNLQVDGNINFGATTTNSEGDTVVSGGNLTANSVSVPYSGSINLVDDESEAQVDDTKINTKGVITPYVRAGSIKTDGITVGESITIADEDDNTLTTVSGSYISTVGYGKIDKYLNVGEPTTPTTTDGDIVAKHDIIAENDIVAKTELRGPGFRVFTPEGGGQYSQQTNIMNLTVVSAAQFEQGLTVNNNQAVKTHQLDVNEINSQGGDDIVINDSAEFAEDIKVLGQVTVGAESANPVVTLSEDGVSIDQDATLVAKTIASIDQEVVIETGTVLKVNNINSSEGTGLTIQQDTEVSKTLKIRGANTNKTNVLEVTSGHTALKNLSAEETAVTGLTVHNASNTAVANIDIVKAKTAVIGPDTSTTFEEGVLKATNKVIAPELYQTVEAVEKKVPYIDIVEQANGTWQLQISRANYNT